MNILSRFFALVLLILISPFLLTVSLISLLSQGRPIMFKQKRIGKDFIPFIIYKFRSMHKSSEGINSFSNGKTFTATKWGVFIRYMKIDELPQLINILKGEMAFVGPRPELPEFTDHSSFNYLQLIKPGLTSYSSILFRDESIKVDFISDQKDYENVLKIKTDLDNFYASKKNILLDFKLIVLTVISIFFPKSMSKLFNAYVLKILNKIEETEECQITAGSNLDFEDNCKKPIFRAN